MANPIGFGKSNFQLISLSGEIDIIVMQIFSINVLKTWLYFALNIHCFEQIASPGLSLSTLTCC
jgi:hypothetical protein